MGEVIVVRINSYLCQNSFHISFKYGKNLNKIGICRSAYVTKKIGSIFQEVFNFLKFELKIIFILTEPPVVINVTKEG